MADTPVFGLHRPAFDTQPWDVLMNDNISIIDAVMARYVSITLLNGIWKNSLTFIASQQVIDPDTSSLYLCNIGHTSAATGLFSADRALHPTYWTLVATQADAGSAVAAEVARALAAEALLAPLANPFFSDPNANEPPDYWANGVSAQLATTNWVGTFVMPQIRFASFKNFVQNSRFRVQQRGAGPFTTNTYTADRWVQAFSGGSCSSTIVPLTTPNNLEYALTANVVGGAAAGDYCRLIHKIEGIERIGGQTNVTVSFCARVAAGFANLGVSMAFYFGTGGAPSPAVYVTPSQMILIGSSAIDPLARQVMVFQLPDTTGMTFGTTPNTDYVELSFWFSSGATLDATSGLVGVQTAIFSVAGVQVEINQTANAQYATPLENTDQQTDWANCRRHYRATQQLEWFGRLVNTAAYSIGSPRNPPMRATPTLAIVSDFSTNFGARTLTANANMDSISATASANADGSLNISYTSSAEL